MNVHARGSAPTRMWMVALAIAAVLALTVWRGAAHAATSSPAQVYSGDYAALFVPPDEAGDYLIYVEVDKLDKTPGAWLYYEIDQWNPDSPEGLVPVEAGSGLIPDGAYTVNGRGVHTLDVDSSALPEFTRWFGAGGRISLTWEKTSFFKATSNGSTTVHYPDVNLHSGGKSAAYSASAAGTVIGHAVTAENAQVGTNQGVTVVIERTR